MDISSASLDTPFVRCCARPALQSAVLLILALGIGMSREIGVRLVLGATSTDVLRLVVWNGLQLVVVGVILNLGASMLATRALRSMLVGVEQLDPVTFGGAALLLLATAAFAALLPALGAARLNPLQTLRSD
jgi:ABC-type antimicrobial peptide transport system permease subunit